MASGSDFTGRIIGACVCVIAVVAIAIPLVQEQTSGSEPAIDPDSILGKIVVILPIFLILAVIMLIVNTFRK